MGVQQKKGSTCFSSASNTRKTYGAHSHAAITCLGHLIVNTASGCSRQALGLNTVIPSCFCTLFWLRTSQCSKSFESERFTMTVMWTVNRGQMFDHCGCASKWERVSVNGSQVGLVCWRHEKPVGHLKLCMYGLTFFFTAVATPNSDILFSMVKEATLQRKNTSWAGSESLWGNEARNTLAHSLMMLQLGILISDVAGPNCKFKCDERGVCMGVRWCLGWWSVLWNQSVGSFTWLSLR